MNTWLFIRSLRPTGGVKKGIRVAVVQRGHKVIGDDRLQTDDLLLALDVDTLACGPGDPVPASPSQAASCRVVDKPTAAPTSVTPPGTGDPLPTSPEPAPTVCNLGSNEVSSSAGGDSVPGSTRPPASTYNLTPALIASATSVGSDVPGLGPSAAVYNLSPALSAGASSGGGDSGSGSQGKDADPQAVATTEKTVTETPRSQVLSNLIQEWQKDQNKYTKLIGKTLPDKQGDFPDFKSRSEPAVVGADNEKAGRPVYRKALSTFQPTFQVPTPDGRLDIGRDTRGKDGAKGLMVGATESAAGSEASAKNVAGDKGPYQTVLCSSLLATTIRLPEESAAGGKEKGGSGEATKRSGASAAAPDLPSAKPGYTAAPAAAPTPHTFLPNIAERREDLMVSVPKDGEGAVGLPPLPPPPSPPPVVYSPMPPLVASQLPTCNTTTISQATQPTIDMKKEQVLANLMEKREDAVLPPRPSTGGSTRPLVALRLPSQTDTCLPPQTNPPVIELNTEELMSGLTERKKEVAPPAPLPDLLSHTATTQLPQPMLPQTRGLDPWTEKKTEDGGEKRSRDEVLSGGTELRSDDGSVTSARLLTAVQVPTAAITDSPKTTNISIVESTEDSGQLDKSQEMPRVLDLTSARYQQLLEKDVTLVKELMPPPGLKTFSVVPGPTVLKTLSSVCKYVPIVGSQLVATSIYSLHSFLAKFDGKKNYMGMYPYFYLLNKYGAMVKLDNPVGADVLLMAVNGREYPVIHLRTKAGRLQSLFDSLNLIRKNSPTLSHMVKFNNVKERSANQPSLKVSDYYYGVEKATDDLMNNDFLTRKYDESEDGEAQLRLLTKWALQGTMSVYFRNKKDEIKSKSDESQKLLECVSEMTRRLRMCESGIQLWRFMPTFDWFHLVENSKQLDRLMMNELAESLGDSSKPEDSRPVVDRLLETEELSTSDLLTPLSDLLLINVNMVARTSVHVLYQLASSSYIQNSVYKEIKEVVDAASEDDSISYEQVNSMSFLRACVFETLRLVPPIPVLSRQLEEDTRINNIVVPKGTLIQMVNVLPWIRGEENFEETGMFQPERWLEPGGGVSGDPLTALPSWNSCPDFNRDLVLTQIALLVAKVIRKFKVETPVLGLKPDSMLFQGLIKPTNLTLRRRTK